MQDGKIVSAGDVEIAVSAAESFQGRGLARQVCAAAGLQGRAVLQDFLAGR